MVRPERVGHVLVAEHAGDAVPVRDPHVVGRRGALEVADRRARASVDAGSEAERVQLVVPPADERLHGLRARLVRRRVPLHVEVERAVGRQPERDRFARRVLRRSDALVRGGSRARRDLLQRRLADARRLQPDVQRHQAPSLRHDRGHPRRREVRLGARAVHAADVDAECAVGRCLPCGERVERRSAARIEAVARVHRRAREACSSRAVRNGDCARGSAREHQDPHPSHAGSFPNEREESVRRDGSRACRGRSGRGEASRRARTADCRRVRRAAARRRGARSRTAAGESS